MQDFKESLCVNYTVFFLHAVRYFTTYLDAVTYRLVNCDYSPLAPNVQKCSPPQQKFIQWGEGLLHSEHTT